MVAMENNRRVVAICVWMISSVLLVTSCIPWFSHDGDLLRRMGTAGALLLLPMGLLFRSKYFAGLVESTPKKSVPAGLLIVSRLLMTYAAIAFTFFVAYWFYKGTVSTYANLMLAPFGVFAFFMGRWILFRP